MLRECDSGKVPSTNFISQRALLKRNKQNGWCRKRWKVRKINIPLVWNSLCCSLCKALAYFLRVSSANVSLLLCLPFSFVLMPQWNRLHMRGRYLRTAVLSSATAFNQLLALIYYFLLSLGFLDFTPRCLCNYSLKTPATLGAWERWPQGLAVGSKIVWSQGRR